MTLDRIAFCNLKQVKSALVLADTQADSTSDADILRVIGEASQFVMSYCHRTFVPFKDTRGFPYNGRAIYSPKWLCPDEEILDLITLVNGDLSSISPSDVTFEPVNISAKNTVCIVDSSPTEWATGVIMITAVWGYHLYYPGAWVLVGTTPALGADDTSMLLSSPIVSPGDLVRVDEEVMYVSSQSFGPDDAMTYTFSVDRAVNGFSNGTHEADADLYKYVVMPDVAMAVSRFTAWLFKTGNSVDNRVQLIDGKTSVIVQQSPSEIWAALDMHIRKPAK